MTRGTRTHACRVETHPDASTHQVPTPSAPGFDRLAPAYHDLWTATPSGRRQREAVWRHTAALFPIGSRVLDLGCGIGDDALMLSKRGVHVIGLDASPEMVRVARARGVAARLCPIEEIDQVRETFHCALSNFGAFNCVERLSDLREPLVRLIDPGWLAICIMSRVCLWETLWYALHGDFVRATRRWKGEAVSSVTPRVFYPTVNAICRALAPDFALAASHGIGVAVPPSYVTGLSDRTIGRLDAIDQRAASWPVLRSLGDHHLLIFRKAGRQ